MSFFRQPNIYLPRVISTYAEGVEAGSLAPSLSFSLSLSLSHKHTHTQTNTLTHSHTHTVSLSLSRRGLDSERSQGFVTRRGGIERIQGYLALKKQPLPRTLEWTHA